MGWTRLFEARCASLIEVLTALVTWCGKIAGDMPDRAASGLPAGASGRWALASIPAPAPARQPLGGGFRSAAPPVRLFAPSHGQAYRVLGPGAWPALSP